MPAFVLNCTRRLGPAIAIGLGCVVGLGAAAGVIFGKVDANWLRVSLVAQVIVVAALALVLARQIVALRRTQISLVAANTDLAGAQASLETNNRMLRITQAELKRTRQQLIDGLEGSADGFALYDAEDRLVVCNSRYRQLFGLHADLLRPGTPFVDGAPAALRAALDAFDLGGGAAAVRDALAAARPADAVSVMNLLVRTDGDLRAAVHDRLAALVPPPPGVTRDAVLALDQRAIDRWWDTIRPPRLEAEKKKKLRL